MTLNDSTGHELVEEAVLGIDEQLLFVTESIPASIAYIDAHMVCRFVNSVHERWFDRPREQVVGLHMSELLDGATMDLVGPYAEAALSGMPSRFESELPYNRTIQRIEFHLIPHRDSRGAVVGFYALALDISERKNVDEALRESESICHSLLSAMEEGVAFYDASGRITAMNPAAERILGLSFEQLIGRTPDDILWQAIHEDGSSFSSELHPATATLKSGRPQVDITAGIRRSDGTLRWITMNSEPIGFDGDRNPHTVVVTFRDVTDRKQFESSLLDMDRRIEAEHEALTRKHEALQEVLAHIEAERNRTKFHISANIDKVILPLIRLLQKMNASNPQQRRIVDRLKRALEEISSTFVGTLSTKFATLSSRELQVCNMVRDGMQSKEIADLLGISVLTVSTIRQQIRGKLCIDNKSVGLAEYLRALK